MNILITGANRGLGLSLVKAGLKNGHTVFAGTRNLEQSKIDDLLQLKQQYQEKSEVVSLDVTNEDSVIEAVKQVKEVTDSIDVIINNAAILNEREKTVEDVDIEACRLALDINTLGPIRVVKHFLPLLEKGQNQSVINVSSEAGSITNTGSGDIPYGISKAALNMFSEKLNHYLREKNVQVLSVHPGWMRTDMGGENARLDPMDPAKSMFEMVERRLNLKSKYVFVNHHGGAMDI